MEKALRKYLMNKGNKIDLVINEVIESKRLTENAKFIKILRTKYVCYFK